MIDPTTWLHQALADDKDPYAIDRALQALRPASADYGVLADTLLAYRHLEAAGGWPQVPDGPTLDPGMNDPRVRTLRARLAATRDLVANHAAQVGQPDPADMEATFDEITAAAVRRFQLRHGLTVDGRVGQQTLAALNVPVSDRINQLRVNLERLRWLDRASGGTQVVVNIAAYSVVYSVAGTVRWQARAIVGRPGRPTPVFRDRLSFLRLNPSWVVPPTILFRDILPEVRRDPAYLQAHHLRVFTAAGVEVQPGTVDWKTTGRASFPYTLRQDPGPTGALGQIAFVFPNRHAVYLHDTPARELFEKPQRMFSSGCVRVEHPLELAQLLLDDPVQWNREALESALAAGKTQRVNLPEKVPILLIYLTAFAGEEGRIHFRDDRYHKDAAVLAALQQPFDWRRWQTGAWWPLRPLSDDHTGSPVDAEAAATPVLKPFLTASVEPSGPVAGRLPGQRGADQQRRYQQGEHQCL